MHHIHEVATVTSKGQITLPKPIRQALGIAVGGRVAFDLRGSEIVVTRAEPAEHQDPAIEAFLSLLEQDIKGGKQLTTLPDDLAQAMLANLRHGVDMDQEIVGDVVL
ncbi:type II toxin-antitoxin system PrlF family antitoxin [uncultured Thiodictyon sp.]|uniref:type II toxin-antitoxin system PrlF family antitoxin n=1 Tax=uncultured Thiodictyon sp. TaxID=1846217 RepID=UPI0025EBACEA|nr:type II toxin-antitoxin system PrlF family antitoxin [uncultured Thiodictyon sp.]